MGGLLINRIDIGTVVADTIAVNERTSRDVVVHVEFVTTTVGVVQVLAIERRLYRLSVLAVERESELDALPCESGGERTRQFRVGRIYFLIRIGELAVAVHILDDRLTLGPTVAGVVIVCFLHLRAGGKTFLLGDVVVGYGHHLVADDTYPLVVIDIVDRLTDEESVVRQVGSRAVDFEHLVMVVRQSERCLPTPTIDIDIDGLQADFDTAVQHRADIGNHRLATCLEG